MPEDELTQEHFDLKMDDIFSKGARPADFTGGTMTEEELKEIERAFEKGGSILLADATGKKIFHQIPALIAEIRKSKIKENWFLAEDAEQKKRLRDWHIPGRPVRDDIDDILAEIRRLQERERKAREIIEKWDKPSAWCLLCRGTSVDKKHRIIHQPDCPIKAWLKGE